MKKRLFKIAMFICFMCSLSFFSQTSALADEEINWTKKASMSEGRYAFQTEVINGKIYAIGGTSNGNTGLQATEVYDPTTDTWTTLSPMPNGRKWFQTEVINGKIYAIGGLLSDSVVLATAEVYDPIENKWTKIASMSEGRYAFQTEAINGKIYAIGGYDSSRNSSLSTAEVYDPTTNTWATVAPMSYPRDRFKTEIIDGKIYAIGGDPSGRNSIEVYDPIANSWTTLASMSTPRYNFDTVVINKKIYAIGGYGASLGNLSTAEAYDPITNSWETVASMSIPRQFVQTEVNNGKIYAIGGTGSKDVSLPTAEVYNPTTNKWKATGSMSVDRSYLRTEVINGKIYAIGGVVQRNAQSLTEVYDTATSDTSSNLKATGGDSKVDLTWNAVDKATSYTVKSATTAGGPYTTIATGVIGTTYTDTDVTNGTTYYYVVTAIINGSEGWNSNEASATPQASTDPNQPTGNKALLVITMVTGERKEYEMTTDKINDFITWYNSKAASSPTYVIEKDYNKASFTARKDYIAYEQISNFEVNEYKNY